MTATGLTRKLATTSAGSARGRRRAVHRCLAQPQGRIGTTLLALVLLTVVIGPLLAPYYPGEVSTALGSGPSTEHLLGTDTLGRDILSRLLYGGRTVLLLPALALVVSLGVATALALLAGYLGGWFDAIVTRMLDTIVAIPGLLLAITIVMAFGGGNLVVVLSVALFTIPPVTRVLRSVTQSVASRDFVLAAKARGDSTWWITVREILPNIAPVLLVEGAFVLTTDILAIASLSYLGLGVQPPEPNWGVMVSENQPLLTLNPAAMLAPALLLAVLGVSIHLIADALTVAGAGREHEKAPVI